MNKLLIALSLALATSSLYAADEKAATPQQEKMKTCNQDAKTKELKGDARKQFMKECLGAGAGDKKEMTPQQQKMQNCNKEAAAQGIKGADRRKFMSSCLKGDAKPDAAQPAASAETKK